MADVKIVSRFTPFRAEAERLARYRDTVIAEWGAPVTTAEDRASLNRYAHEQQTIAIEAALRAAEERGRRESEVRDIVAHCVITPDNDPPRHGCECIVCNSVRAAEARALREAADRWSAETRSLEEVGGFCSWLRALADEREGSNGGR